MIPTGGRVRRALRGSIAGKRSTRPREALVQGTLPWWTGLRHFGVGKVAQLIPHPVKIEDPELQRPLRFSRWPDDNKHDRFQISWDQAA
jgi:hypothetical protein